MSTVPHSFPTNRTIVWLFRIAIVVLILGVGDYIIQGAHTTTRPKLVTNGATASRVKGFDQIAFSVRSSQGVTSRHCGLLALTTAQQDQGLMNRTDLAGYDAMVFQFVEPTTVEFYMKDTLIPLSIAWFGANGHFLSATDMSPCGTAAVCPLYAAKGAYTDAIEVPEGRLGLVGAGPGSTLTVGGSC
jgi:uncharacterized membrane protein (UPF0127 family)